MAGSTITQAGMGGQGDRLSRILLCYGTPLEIIDADPGRERLARDVRGGVVDLSVSASRGQQRYTTRFSPGRARRGR